MGTLHDALIKALADVGPMAFAELVAKKVAKHGVQLTPRQKKRIVENFNSLDDRPLLFHSGKSRSTTRIDISITPAEVRNIQCQLTNLHKGLSSRIQPLIDGLAPSILNSLRKRWPAESRYQRREMGGFEAGLMRRWKKPLGALLMLLTMARKLGANINDNLHAVEPIERPASVEVLTRLHARACQITAEILVLLSSGFADGAMARWRSLHEIAVIAMFIVDKGEGVAERYFLHNGVESRRAAQEYQRYYKRLGYEPFETAELEDLEISYQHLIEKFGKEYGGQYGWAAQPIGKERPTFVDIERAVRVDHLRPFYKLASYNVHANPKGIFSKLGLVKEHELLLTGSIDIGLAEPGQDSALSLTQASSALGQLCPTLDSMVVLKMMLILSREIGEMFVRVQEPLEQNQTEKTVNRKSGKHAKTRLKKLNGEK